MARSHQILAALLLVGVLVGCAEPPQAEVRIGVISAFSGPLYGPTGRSVQEGAALAAAQVNEAGGLDVAGRRHRVVLLFEDNADNPNRSVDAARKLINRDGVVALIGPTLSRNALPAALVAEQYRIPLISPGSTNPALTAGRRYSFRISFVDDVQGRAIAQFARQDLGAETAAVLFDVASAYNKNIAAVFKQHFEDAGGAVVAFEAYTTGQQDFRAHLARIREAAPDVLYLPNYANEVPLQAEQARQAGIEAILLGSDAWDATLYAAQPVFDNAFFTDDWFPDVADADAEAFIEAYRQRYGHAPFSQAALTYDAFGVLFQAIESSGSLASEPLREALAQIEDYPGVTGTISYRGTGDPLKRVLVLQIKDGQTSFFKQIETLWRDDKP